MKNKKIERPILVTFICIVAICAVISIIQIIFPSRERKASTSEEASQTEEVSQEEPMESQPASGSGSSNSTDSQAGSDEESAEGSTGEDVSLEFREEDFSSISETQIGSVTVKFHTDDAMVGEGTVLGEQMDSILFHDGIEEDMKGYMFATKVDYDGGTIDSIEAAQSSVSEYIPAGSGITSNWEETEEYFIRKATGYDNEADGAFIFYTVIPKSDRSDPFFYSIVAVGYENDLIKESSYDSMMDAMYGHIPDSSLLDLTYDEACTELEEALYNQSGAGEKLGMNGVDELRDANMQWYHDVYGVDSMEEYEAMSEEEKKNGIGSIKTRLAMHRCTKRRLPQKKQPRVLQKARRIGKKRLQQRTLKGRSMESVRRMRIIRKERQQDQARTHRKRKQKKAVRIAGLIRLWSLGRNSNLFFFQQKAISWCRI